MKYRKKHWSERFWPKVDKTSFCWNWTGHKQIHSGYGVFWYRNSIWKSHRVMWVETYGEIPHKINVLHECDNPACVNPDHLFLGTHQDNMKDKVQKGRHMVGYNRLTREDVVIIKELIQTKKLTIAQLAAQFQVTSQAIFDIKSGKSWNFI